MIDSRATGNFITRKVAETQGFKTQSKTNFYLLIVVDREPILTNNRIVTYKTVLLEIVML